MLDDDNTSTPESTGTTQDAAAADAGSGAPAKKAAAKKAPARKRTTAKKAAAAPPEGDEAELTAPSDLPDSGQPADEPAAPAKKAAAKKTAAKAAPAKKAAAKKAPAKKAAAAPAPELDLALEDADAEAAALLETPKKTSKKAAAAPPVALLFQAPEPVTAPKRTRKPAKPVVEEPEVEPDEAVEGAEAAETAEAETEAEAEKPKTPRKQTPRAKQGGGRNAPRQDRAAEAPEDESDESDDESDEDETEGDSESASARRRRRRGGRRRRKPNEGESDESDESEDEGDDETAGRSDDSGDETGEGTGTRRRRRRVRAGEQAGGEGSDDPQNTVTRVRKVRSAEDEITSVQGSTRLEAKKQRRREGREAGRRRAPIVSEAEFLARRESVDRVMVIRQRDDLTQIAVLEDKVLVEHYVARESQTSLIGNVYVGRVQNVLPSMEAAFVDIGKGRNAVLYAGEVNWSALGHRDGQPRKIESVLSSGQSVLVQVTKDPVGHKGARLTSQVSLAGRFLVYVPDGTTSGISRKLPDTERSRLKALLKEIVPDTAGVIVRTAAEGASEEELTRDVERLKARWEDIEAKAKAGNAPQMLYGEPDLTLKVVRDLFTEDFTKLVIQGDDAWDTVQGYVVQVAPDLEERLERYDGDHDDVFAAYRIDEQIAKGLDRKVWLPSGGSLIIDRTEAMTVVDVNTGKFTGSGGNLEETVTKNNLEAAEEMVRQLRLRDIGGIIVVDFIDMVLESNRDLVLRRLVECLGRDRTRHQVAEVTSLGLVQMTRKRIGTGLLEAFSENCDHCQGRGVVIKEAPVEPRKSDDAGDRRGRRGRGRGANEGGNGNGGGALPKPAAPSPKAVAAVARPENAARPPLDELDDTLVDGAAPVEEPTSAETAAASHAPAAPERVISEPAASETVVPETAAPQTAAPEIRTSVREPGQRSSRRSTRPVVRADESAASSSSTEEAPAEQPAAVQEQPVERPVEAAQPPAEPAAPKVVTRTRRSASRPAGASPASTPLEPVAIVVAEPVNSEPPAHTPVVEPPKVVTRTRRAVSRPAGAAAVVDAASTTTLADGPVDGAAATDGADDHAGPELHVPIKKKGARKR